MACEYQLPGSDTWISENEFKQMLHDGLLDKLMIDNNLAIRGIKPDQAKADSYTGTTPKAEAKPVTAPVAEAPKAETKETASKAEAKPKAPKGENVKTDSEGFVAVEANIRGSRMAPEYNDKGKLSSKHYSAKISEDGTKATIKNQRGEVVVANGAIKTNPDVGTRYVVAPNGTSVYIDQKIPASIETESEVQKEAAKQDKRGERQVVILPREGNIGPRKMVFNRRKNAWQLEKDGKLEDVSERLQKQAQTEWESNSPSKKIQKSLEEQRAIIEENERAIAEANEGNKEYEELKDSEEVKDAIEVISTPTQKKTAEKNIDQEIEAINEDIDYTERRIEDLNEEIDIEKANLKDEKARIKVEIAEVKNSNLSKEEKEDKIDELKAELEEIQDNHDAVVESYRDDIKAENADLNKLNKKKQRLEQQKTEGPKKGKGPLMSTQRRGNASTFTERVLNMMGKAFPKLGIVIDQQTFDDMADSLGRSRSEAAIIDRASGMIYLNPNVANDNTVFEEYAHVYLTAAEQSNKPIYEMGITLIQQEGQEYIDEILNDPGYADISNDPRKVAFEALSKMIADRAEKVSDARREAPLKEWLKDFWKWIGRKIFGFSAKVDVSRDNLDTYVEMAAREMTKGVAISSVTKEQLSNILDNKNNSRIGYPLLEPNSILNVNKPFLGIPALSTSFMRKVFAADKGIGKKNAMELSKARKQIAIVQIRANKLVDQMNKGLDEYVKENPNQDVFAVKQKIDQALKDPVFRADWFSNDSDANSLIKPSVVEMRKMIDGLSKSLMDQGFIDGKLEASIAANSDMYVHTSYYAFAPTGYKGNWMDLFSKNDQADIVDWMFNNAYQNIESIKFDKNSNGTVTAKFTNGFGQESDPIQFNDIRAFKQYLDDNMRYAFSDKAKVNLRKLGFTLGARSGELKPMAPVKMENLTENLFNMQSDIILNKLNSTIANKDTDRLGRFIGLTSELVSQNELSIAKKKRDLPEPYKKFLMEIKDPEYNFVSTVMKQASYLFKGSLENEILNSGYLSSASESGNLTKEITRQGSLLNGRYVSPEMFDFLEGKQWGGDYSQSGFLKAIAAASAFTKSYLTIFSPGSNAANYFSGYLQLAKTGNLPIGMITAMRAIEKTFSKSENKIVKGEEITSALVNTVPTIIRWMTNVNGETSKMKNANIQLTDDQKAFYGVSDYNSLDANQKAQVMMEEFISMGIINSNIDAEILKEFAQDAFSGIEIPEEAVRSRISKLRNKAKAVTKDVFDYAGAAYSFSDSMFKAIAYMSEKQKNLDTYGKVMLAKGDDPAVVEQRMREMAANQIREQMPSYDRSPDFLKALSKFPLIGTFIQFDFQSKINDKNILLEAVKLLGDARQMNKEANEAGIDPKVKEALNSASQKLYARSATKMLGFTTSLFASTAIYSIIASMYNWLDDDDEALRKISPDYRKYNILIPLDGNSKGVHEYIDINRIDPMQMYHRYWRAFSEDGAGAMAEEILKPYISSDIFIGSVYESLVNLDKYGNLSDKLRDGSIIDKLQYALTERLLPSGMVGQVIKVVQGFQGKESSPGMKMNGWMELSNALFGIKSRSINMGENLTKKIKFEHESKLSKNSYKLNFDEAISERDKIAAQLKRPNPSVTKADLQEAETRVQEAKKLAEAAANEQLNQSRELVQKFMNLKDAYTEDELREEFSKKETKDEKTIAKWYVNAIFDPNFVIKYNDDGEIIKARSGGSILKSKDEFGLDLDLDLDLDLGL